jgi:hypothetical protein
MMTIMFCSLPPFENGSAVGFRVTPEADLLLKKNILAIRTSKYILNLFPEFFIFPPYPAVSVRIGICI